MDHPWPLSAGIPGAGLPPYSMEVHRHGPPRQHPALGTPQSGDVDPRVLFATRFWGRRRFSDSFSQLPHALTAQALRQLNLQNHDGNSHPNVPTKLTHDLPPPSTSVRSFPRPPPQQHIVHHYHHHYYHHCPPSTTISRSSLPASPSAHAHARAPPPSPSPSKPNSIGREQRPRTGFLDIPGYAPHTIHPRNPLPLPTRREEFVDALAKVEARAGPVTLKGVGHLARPLVANKGRVLSSFLEGCERTLLVPTAVREYLGEGGSAEGGGRRGRGNGDGNTERKGTGTGLGQRELGMLESELFDVSKFLTAGEGGVGGRYLTVLSWSEDSAYGTVTLFEVEVDAPPPLRRTVTVAGGGEEGLAARRRLVPAPLSLSSSRERVLGVKPVAAMEDVPQQVLVGMRLDQGIKKVVLQHERGSGRFRWTAQHTRQGPASYARVARMEDSREVHTASGTGFDNDFRGRTSRRARRRDARRRERSSLRVEDARHIVSHSQVEDDCASQDVYGVVATIPQFLALLHATRCIVEKASSTPATTSTVTTEDGKNVRAVSIDGVPKGTRHRGRDVHVVVLVPDGAKWAEERIFWTDDKGGLAELRQKKYREVIDSGRARLRREARAYDRDWDARSLSPLSSPLTPKSARW